MSSDRDRLIAALADAAARRSERDGAEDEDRPSPIVARLAAAIIDFTIVLVAVLPIQLLWTHPDRSGGSTTDVPTSAANWLSLAVLVAYPVVGVGHYGRTLGKAAVSLRVLRSDGRPAGWVASIVRFAVSFAPFLTGPLIRLTPEGAARTAAEIAQVALMALVYLPIPFDDQRRGLHDRIAGTRVVCRVPPLLRPPVGGAGPG